MFAVVKTFLNKITMYRLMLYYLLILFVASIFLSFFDIFPFSSINIILSGAYLVIICVASNRFFAKFFKANTNIESAYITALILTLIITPSDFLDNLVVLTFVGVIAMASKYLLVFRKKHIFNPAAISVVLGAIIFKVGASWWIGGSIYMLPIIAIGGILVLLKIKRFLLVSSFISVYFIGLLLIQNLTITLLLSPVIWFFVFVMLIEPLTSPSTKKFQILFGGLVAAVYIFILKFIPSYPYVLETSLVVGNLFNFTISKSFNMHLTFVKSKKVAKSTWSFYFKPKQDFNFLPGQYIEWTLPHKNADSRGARRFFTISSAPNEKLISITMKISKKGSSFKKHLLKLKEGDKIIASNPQGDFVLPKNKSQPLAFITGGIGVTPFRSMIKFLLEENESRNIILLYSNDTNKYIAFKDLFNEAHKIGVKTIYVNTKKYGYVNRDLIVEKIPDYNKRMFYVSGPEAMVEDVRKILSDMNVKDINTDYFPGYANLYPALQTVKQETHV